MPYGSNPPFLIFDIRTLWRSGLSARAPECQKLKIKNGGSDQYGAEPFEQQQFGTAGVKGLSRLLVRSWSSRSRVTLFSRRVQRCRIFSSLPAAQLQSDAVRRRMALLASECIVGDTCCHIPSGWAPRCPVDAANIILYVSLYNLL